MNTYDVIIIGAGNAGLSAGINLAKEGKKTLIIEQHNLPGGCASSFIRGRFEFETSLHELCDIGSEKNPGEIRELFNSYGVNNIEWVKTKDSFRVVSKYSDEEEMDVIMPSGKKEFIEALEKYVPKSKRSIEQLFNLIEEIIQGLSYLSSKNADIDELKENFPNLLTTGSYSVVRVFDALGIPYKAQDILSTYWPYLGVDLERLSFVHYAVMLYKYISKGAYIPKNTSHEISLKLLEKYKELGGEILFNCRALNILFEGENASGVATTLGDIEGKYVLANVNSDIVYGSLVPPYLVNERLKKLYVAREKKYSGIMFNVYLGLNKDYRELNIKDYNTFIMDTSDSVEQFKNIQEGIESNNFAIFLCNNVINQSASPAGTCICSITTLVSSKDFEDLKGQEYIDYKQKVAEKLINLVENKLNINIKDNIEEIEIATPLTFARYLNAPNGSVYGHETNEWDNILARMQSIKEDNPLQGLKVIGADGPRGDGYSSTYLCGKLISDIVLDELNERGTKDETN